MERQAPDERPEQGSIPCSSTKLHTFLYKYNKGKCNVKN